MRRIPIWPLVLSMGLASYATTYAAEDEGARRYADPLVDQDPRSKVDLSKVAARFPQVLSIGRLEMEGASGALSHVTVTLVTRCHVRRRPCKFSFRRSGANRMT